VDKLLSTAFDAGFVDSAPLTSTADIGRLEQVVAE